MKRRNKMDKMLVGIDYTQEGKRTIGTLVYEACCDNSYLKARANDCKVIDDEVYIVDFNPNYEEFINEIVLKGCRI